MPLFSRRLSAGSLIQLCRSVRYCLTGGMMLRETMDLLAAQGPRALRPVCGRITRELKAGWNLQQALAKESAYFPPLFLAMVEVGEESGNLAEVLLEVEKYYEVQLRLRREFISEITWPVVQLVLAVLIVACLIFVVGLIRPGTVGQQAPVVDPLGLGLVGSEGAVTFLAWVFGVVLALAVTYRLARRLLRQRAVVERTLLLIPGIGPCLRGLALTRLSVALQFMLETSMSVTRSFRLALAATDNAAYVAVTQNIVAGLRQGNDIASCLARDRRLFPEAFRSAVVVAERSGRLPEMFLVQAAQYDDEVKRRLALLNKIASGLVWLGVAAIIIFAIIRIFKFVYLNALEKYMPR